MSVGCGACSQEGVERGRVAVAGGARFLGVLGFGVRGRALATDARECMCESMGSKDM